MATVSILVFIVEDEPLIREVLEAALQDGGFEIAKASSGTQAMSMLDAHIDEYQALITDVNLGREAKTGWDVARHGRELNPALPVIYMTGDSAADWAVNGVPNSVLLEKPFAPAQLVTAVSHLLNTAPPHLT